MSEKVFCKNCEHISLGWHENSNIHICRSHVKKVFSYSYWDKIYSEQTEIAKEKNKFNDCKDYQPKFLIRLKNIFK